MATKRRKSSKPYVPQPSEWLGQGLGGSCIEDLDDFPAYRGIDTRGAAFRLDVDYVQLDLVDA